MRARGERDICEFPDDAQALMAALIDRPAEKLQKESLTRLICVGVGLLYLGRSEAPEKTWHEGILPNRLMACPMCASREYLACISHGSRLYRIALRAQVRVAFRAEVFRPFPQTNPIQGSASSPVHGPSA